MVYLKIEAFVTINGIESCSTTYTSFPNDEIADKYIKSVHEQFTKCRSVFKKNRIRKPIITKVPDLPAKQKAYLKSLV